jgi:MFS family permease
VTNRRLPRRLILVGSVVTYSWQNRAMSLRRPDRIPRHVRVLLAANFVSSVGSGLTLPFLLIYLHEVRHISLGIAGLLIGGTGVVAIPTGPASGALVDRIGPRWVLVGATSLEAIGTTLLVLVRSPVSAVPVLLVFGVAGGAVWPTWSSIFAVMVHDEGLRPRVFARSFQLLNLGLGAGSVIAGAVVHVRDPGTFDLIYVVDGTTYLAITIALLLLPADGFRIVADPAAVEARQESPRGGYREVLSDRRFVRYLVSSGFLVFCGYAAISAGLVGYATVVVHAEPYVIAWAFAVNTALIVAIQPLALRVVDRMRRSTALSLCALIWGSSWVLLGLAGLFPRSHVGEFLVIAMFAVFALGEVLLSPVGGPLVSMMSTPGLQGRYMATSSSVFNVSTVLGPAVAGVMLGAGLGDAYLGLLVACGAVAVVGFQWMRRVLPPEMDNAPSARGRDGPTESPTKPALASPVGGSRPDSEVAMS